MSARPCPEILRQRLVLEGIYGVGTPDESFIRGFLLGLGDDLGMRPISDVMVFSPDAVSDLHHGIAGFLPWVESGCSLYTWARQRLFVLEVFSCKAFDPGRCEAYAVGRLEASALHRLEI